MARSRDPVPGRSLQPPFLALATAIGGTRSLPVRRRRVIGSVYVAIGCLDVALGALRASRPSHGFALNAKLIPSYGIVFIVLGAISTRRSKTSARTLPVDRSLI